MRQRNIDLERPFWSLVREVIGTVYNSIEWPVIVLLGSMIPIGGALESTGSTSLIADGIVSLAAGEPPAASCAFLTPIGHKNKTLIIGPGGYRFGDYWRMGLPLVLLVIAVSVPMILWVWPLYPA